MKHRLFIFSLCAAFFASCSSIDDADIGSFNVQNPAELSCQVVVNGGVTSEMCRQSVVLSTPYLWNQGSFPEMPQIQRVYVACEKDTIDYSFCEHSEILFGDIFRSDYSFKGEVGKTYRLVVETDEGLIWAEDKVEPLTLHSSADLLKSIVKIRTIVQGLPSTYSFPRHIFNLSEKPIIIAIHNDFVTDSIGATPYQYSLLETPELSVVHPEYSMEAMFASSGFRYAFSVDGDSTPFQVKTYSVSDAYYAYLKSMFNETDWSMGIFATIPGNTSSNVNNGYGFFYATDVTSQIITAGDLKP